MGALRFAGLPGNCTIGIYTFSGKLVVTLKDTLPYGEITWDGRNFRKNPAAGGLYIYVLTDGQGNRKTGKIAVQ